MASDALVRLTNVGKTYDTVADGGRVSVLDEISLDFQLGDSVAIIGPSGCGKSTLLNIIGTLDFPSRGQVILDGDNLSGLTETKLAEVRNRKIGFIFQAHHLLPQCTVLENVMVPTLAGETSLRIGAEERGRKLLERVGLRGRLSHRPGQLSGGERQRVAVVRALINQPKLLLADEPTGALDRQAAHELIQLLVDLNREQKVTLILVTHALEGAARMKRQFELRDGKLVEKQEEARA